MSDDYIRGMQEGIKLIASKFEESVSTIDDPNERVKHRDLWFRVLNSVKADDVLKGGDDK